MKNEYAQLLVIPLVAFIVFWFLETKKNQTFTLKEIDVEFLDGRKELVDINALNKVKDKFIKSKDTDLEKIKYEMEKIYGVEKCFMFLDISGTLLIKILPVELIAKYVDSEGKSFYIDTNFNFLKIKREINDNNMFLITNETCDWRNKQEDLDFIYKKYKEPQKDFIYKFNITKQGDLASYSVIDNKKTLIKTKL